MMPLFVSAGSGLRRSVGVCRRFVQAATVTLFATLPAFAKAQFPQPPDIPGMSNETGVQGIRNVILKVITVVLDFIALLAVLFIIIAGIRLVVSGGDEGQKDIAKKTIIYVIVGLIVIIFARVIVTFVTTAFVTP